MISNLQCDIFLPSKEVFDSLELDIDDKRQCLSIDWVEDDHVIESVEKLWSEIGMELCTYVLLYTLSSLCISSIDETFHDFSRTDI